MRKYAILKNPMPMNHYGDMIRKVMIYQTKKEGVYVFLSTTTDDNGCNADCLFDELESAEAYCFELGVAPDEWVMIEDPLPNCLHDFINPVRNKQN